MNYCALPASDITPFHACLTSYPHFANLKRLRVMCVKSLSGTPVRSIAVAPLLQAVQHLQKLRYFTLCLDTDLTPIPRLPSLRSLEILTPYSYKPDYLLAALPSFAALQYLAVSRSVLDCDIMPRFVAALPKSLRGLNIRSNRVQDFGVKVLLAEMPRLVNLEHLST